MNLFSISGTIALDANPAKAALAVTAKLAENLAGELADLGVASVKLAGDFQASANSLAVFAGGVNLAQRELKAIDQAARNTAGLRLESAEQGYVQLRNLGFQAETTKNLIIGLGRERLLSNADDLSVQRVITNFTQISSSTARFGQDFKEIIHSMPTLRAAFYDAFQTLDPKKLKTFFSDNPDEAFKKLADAMAKTQGASGGLNDAIGKLDDAWMQAGRAFGEPLLDELTQDTKLFTEAIYNNLSTFEHWGETVNNIIRGVRKTAQDESIKDSALFKVLDKLTYYSPLRHLDGVTKFSPVRVALEYFEAEGAKDSTKNVPIYNSGDYSLLSDRKKNINEQIRLDREEEENRQKSIAGIKNYKDVVSNVYKDLYAVQDAMLNSYLQNSAEDEIKSLKDRQTAKANYLNNEIKLQTNSFDKLIALEKDDKEKQSKLEVEKNKVISDLNSQLAVSSYNTQRQIREKEKQILDQRRSDLLSFKNFQVQEIQASLENLNFNTQKQLSGSNATTSLNSLINEYNSSYKKMTAIVKEQYALQLQNQDLTAQQRINLEKQMNLELQRLARDNSRAILQIQEDQIQRLIGKFETIGASMKAFREAQVQLFSTIFDSAFNGNNLSQTGIEKYLKSFDKTDSYEKLKDVLTESYSKKLTFESSIGADQIDLTQYNIKNLSEQFKDDPKQLKEKIELEQSYLKMFLANNTKIQDDLIN